MNIINIHLAILNPHVKKAINIFLNPSITEYSEDPIEEIQIRKKLKRRTGVYLNSDLTPGREIKSMKDLKFLSDTDTFRPKARKGSNILISKFRSKLQKTLFKKKQDEIEKNVLNSQNSLIKYDTLVKDFATTRKKLKLFKLKNGNDSFTKHRMRIRKKRCISSFSLGRRKRSHNRCGDEEIKKNKKRRVVSRKGVILDTYKEQKYKTIEDVIQKGKERGKRAKSRNKIFFGEGRDKKDEVANNYRDTAYSFFRQRPKKRDRDKSGNINQRQRVNKLKRMVGFEAESMMSQTMNTTFYSKGLYRSQNNFHT